MNDVVDLQAARLRAARRRTLAFAEIALAVFAAVEQHVRLPRPALPDLDVPPEPAAADVAEIARRARRHLGVPTGPVPNMVRLLEAHGVAVVRFDHDRERRVRTFSHLGHRPVVLLDASGHDKAADRFDAARELGHLLMHRPTGAGVGHGPVLSRRMALQARAEQRAHAFAAEFLAPAEEVVAGLPSRPDWPALQELKRRWGVGLAELVRRGHDLGRFTPADTRHALEQLAAHEGPEPFGLGPPEPPVLLPRALRLLGHPGDGAADRDGPEPFDLLERAAIDGVLADLAVEAALPLDVVHHVARAAGVGTGSDRALQLQR